MDNENFLVQLLQGGGYELQNESVYSKPKFDNEVVLLR